MSKIQQSDSLKELERIIEQSREFLPDHTKSIDHFEREKKIFDEKISKGRFAFLAKRQDFYHELINSIDSSSAKMKLTIDKSSDQMSRVLKMRDEGNSIKKNLS